MLDKAHALMLRGVAKGIPDGKAPAPALQALIDAGLVAEHLGREPRRPTQPSPGRDGLIVFQAQTGDHVQLHTVRPDGRDLRQITNADGDSIYADWSPDGRRLVYEHYDPLSNLDTIET